MADIVVTDAGHADVRVLRGCRLDVEFGDAAGSASSANSLCLTVDVDSGQRVAMGAFVYVEGTEYGGIVDASETDPEERTVSYTGRSWHGVLAGKVIEPPAGQDRRTVSGEATGVLLSLVDLLGLSGVMTAGAPGPVEVPSYSFERYTDAYTGVRKMLAASGARLSIAYDASLRKAVLSAEPLRARDVGPTSDDALITVRRVHRCVNHLISLGTGEGAQRVVRHDYADAAGSVSQTQTLFGADEICETYEYTTADAEQLAERGPERLRDLQETGSYSATVDGGAGYAVGETVPGCDIETGETVMVPIASEIVTVTDTEVSVEYRAGDLSASPARYVL